MMLRVLSLAALVAMAVPAAAQAPERCGKEVFPLERTRVTFSYCVAEVQAAGNGKPVNVSINETFSTAAATFSRTATLEFLGGEETSRDLQDVPLDRLGLRSILHLGFALRGRIVRLDSAMLLPGGIILK